MKKANFPAVQEVLGFNTSPTRSVAGPKSMGWFHLWRYEAQTARLSRASENLAKVAENDDRRIKAQMSMTSTVLNATEHLKADHIDALARQQDAKSRSRLLLAEAEKKSAEAKGALIEMSRDELEYQQFKLSLEPTKPEEEGDE